MKRKSLTGLGETEMEVLNHVWDLTEATVGEVHARILRTRPVAYTTVMTVMKNLTEKGYLTYRQEGVQYVYAAARPAEDVRSSLLNGLMEKVFGGSPAALVQTLVRHESMSDAEREELRQIIDGLDDTPRS